MITKNLTSDIKRNKHLIYSSLASNYNLKYRDIILKGNINCLIIYIDGISDKDTIEKHIISPLLFRIDTKLPNTSSLALYISKRYISINSTEISNEVKKLCESLKRGQTIIFLDNDDNAIICDTFKDNFRKVSDAKIEENIRGAKSAFVENIKINISMIQEKLINNNLRIERYVFGKENNIEGALLYLEGTIDKKILSKIKEKLNHVKANYIPDTGMLMQYMEKRPFSVFPQYKTVEKPDKAVSDIIQGKAIIFVNGCSYAVTVPVVFIEFFQAFEDYSNKIVLANFDRFIRLIALLIILLASPLYLVLISYNIDLIPQDLIYIISESRQDIPLPPFIEILLMEIVIEFLREGGLRLPSMVGQTLSIVGGIILGQAAINSGFVSPTTLVVISVTVICTFLIPNYEMSLTIRLCRFVILILAQILGLFGIMLGLFALIAYLISIDSFSVPYLSPIAPTRHKDLKDSLIRGSLKNIDKVPKSFKEGENNN